MEKETAFKIIFVGGVIVGIYLLYRHYKAQELKAYQKWKKEFEEKKELPEFAPWQFEYDKPGVKSVYLI